MNPAPPADRPVRQPRLAPVLASLAMVAGLCTLPALADEYADIQLMLRQGKAADALVRIDKGLAAKPRDVQLRFMKGVALNDSGKAADAAAVYTGLTQEFPELPEPYNNLAVILASQGALDKARVALEMAIRLNPSYAVAHDNLGDVYARMAAQAWAKSIELDAGNTAAGAKLNLVREIVAPRPGAKAPARPAR